MKRLVLALTMLLLTSCGPAVQGGNITGKYTKHRSGVIEDTTRYFLQVQKNGNNGEIEVTKEAWDQAKSGMVWPFEVKK